jgi:hypothetical protein
MQSLVVSRCAAPVFRVLRRLARPHRIHHGAGHFAWASAHHVAIPARPILGVACRSIAMAFGLGSAVIAPVNANLPAAPLGGTQGVSGGGAADVAGSAEGAGSPWSPIEGFSAIGGAFSPETTRDETTGAEQSGPAEALLQLNVPETGDEFTPLVSLDTEVSRIAGISRIIVPVANVSEPDSLVVLTVGLLGMWISRAGWFAHGRSFRMT